jgi:hypothetical protein
MNMNKQRGFSLFALIFWGAILVFVAIVGMRVLPAYIQYFTVKKILVDLGADPALQQASPREIRDKYTKRALIDNVDMVKADDLVIDRSAQRLVVTADYTFVTRLFGNVSLMVHFTPSSENPNSGIMSSLNTPVE